MSFEHPAHLLQKQGNHAMLRQTPLEQAINDALEQIRAELMRFYADGDVGTVCVHVGLDQMRVKATPERTREPVRVKPHSSN